MNKDNKNTKKIVDAINSRTCLPCDLFEGEFRLELRGRHKTFLCGCRRIIKYSENEMVIEAKNLDVHILGRGLVCSSFHCSGIVVEGLVENIRLEDKI